VSNRPFVYAHRGACRRATENTIEAFAIARELGADGVELDVRRTHDGVLILHHDASIEGFGVLGEHDHADVLAVAPHVPTLADALAELRGLTINVEVKCLANEPDFDADRSVMGAVVAMIDEFGLTDSVVISSFDLTAVDHVRTLDPRVATGFLTVGVDPPIRDEVKRTIGGGHDWFHPYWQLLLAAGAAETIERLHAAGVRTDVWTLDDPDAARTLAAAGVDAIITNVPEIILAALD
jgi:glycerophosphoryl diester phosphodiesterase